MKFQAVLFDLDGVIIDSEQLHEQAFREVLSNYGYQLTHASYLANFAGKTDLNGFFGLKNQIDNLPSLEQLIREKANAYSIIAQSLTPYDGITSLIKELYDQGIKLALVTGSLRAEAELALKTCNLNNQFEVIVAAEDVKNGKPSPEGYQKVARLLDVTPSRCAVVEDSPSGVDAAVSAGMFCVAITNTHSAEDLGSANLVVGKLSSSIFLDTDKSQ